MFEELVKQARRLFSTKSNGGKQVPQLTDRLHTYKQVVMAIAIVLLLGYSQFREHFKCRGNGDWDVKFATNFCLINGTRTVIIKASSAQSPADPHTGLSYATTGSEQKIDHNYARSYWPLLILMALCSHLAQRKWASLFQEDFLRALLQLVGSGELRQVRAAEKARPYEVLSALSKEPKRGRLDYAFISQKEQALQNIDSIEGEENIYDRTLDYYPNQLTYLLLTKNTASFKLSCLKLRRKLIVYALVSTSLSLLQFMLALVFLGSDYSLYGWSYFRATIDYMLKQLSGDTAALDNSIDYGLSSTIFPTTAICPIKQFGPTGMLESFTVQCMLAINEICSKLFAVIWWVLVGSLIVELYSLIMILLCSLSFKTTSSTFGFRFWPHTRQQAHLIATFRHKRSILVSRSQNIRRSPSSLSEVEAGSAPESLEAKLERKKKLASDLSYHLDDATTSAKGSSCSREKKEWYMWCLQDVFRAIYDFVAWIVCCGANKRHEHLEREAEKDINVLYLLYLLYLRLGKSKSKIEEVIKMTACALENYLVELEAHCDNSKCSDKIEDKEQDADDYKSLDRAGEIIRMC